MSMTSSTSPLIVSGMTENNRPHEAPVRDFLTGIISRPLEHAKFMNMLSMLEHMGSRKIMVSQMNRTLTEDILKHLAEEARHAYFFKRQAERIAKKSLDGYTDENTMQRIPALMYFGRLDAGITKAVAPQLLSTRKRGPSEAQDHRFPAEGNSGNESYPWVSLIIELRACWLYGIYNDVLSKSGLKLSLKSLLAEEDMHLAEMFEMCGENHDRLRALSAYETDLFGKLWNKLCIALPMAKAA